MKKISLSILLLTFILLAAAQPQSAERSVPAGKDAIITINGKAFHDGDAVAKESLKDLFPNKVAVAPDAKAWPIKAESFECVISVKDSNTLYQFNTEGTNGNPGQYQKVLDKTKPKDLLFIDMLKYPASTPVTYPTAFSFVIK